MDTGGWHLLFFLLMKRFISKQKKNPTLDEALVHGIWEKVNAPNSLQSKRVRHILDLLLDLRERMGTVGAIMALRELEKPLERYRWATQLSITRAGVRVGLRGVWARGQPTEEDFWEYGAVSKILELIQTQKGLARFYRCGFCKKTLFARTNKGRPPEFCPDTTCKQLDHDSKPENKKNKSVYMKEYYEAGKKRRNNRKSGVGLRERRARAYLTKRS